MDVLNSCEVAIKKKCKPPPANDTFLRTCQQNAESFNTTVTGCIKMATEGKDACSCFQDSAVTKAKKNLEKCKGIIIYFKAQ